MKKQNLLTAFLLIMIVGCNDLNKRNPEMLSSLNVFVLCEGNFGQLNASLWYFNPEETTMQGPIYQNLTGAPLGDVGQSLTISGDQLYVINNNSHTVKILNLGNEISVVKEISLPGASPRYLAVKDNKAYITCWYLNGIAVLDLYSYTLVDTLPVNGMPEEILESDGYFYVSLKMNSDWSDGNQVLKLDTDGNILTSYQVVPGPGAMVIHDDTLFVASKYYDQNWNTYAGTSTINLSTGIVAKKDYGATADYGDDLFIFQNQVYRIYAGGVAPLESDLSIVVDRKIGAATTIYSANAYRDYIYFGLSDFEAPDEVQVLDSDGLIVNTYTTGAIPGSFAFFEQ